MTAAVLCAALLAGAGSAPPADAADANQFLYVPPALAGNVLLYHSFSRGVDRPEVNRLGGRLVAAAGGLADGLTGQGYRALDSKGAVRLERIAWPLHRPITAGLWWRLEEPMKAESAFHLLSFRARQGYISNFVRGKGTWCALTEPTFVVQVYSFPGITNVNGIRFGKAWTDSGKWHHAAVTVSDGSKVCVYWDGRPRSEFFVKGRMWGPKDVVQSIDLGPTWLSHPMTIDEVLVLDRALSGEEIADYVTAVGKLAEVGFPFRQGGG